MGAHIQAGIPHSLNVHQTIFQKPPPLALQSSSDAKQTPAKHARQSTGSSTEIGTVKIDNMLDLAFYV